MDRLGYWIRSKNMRRSQLLAALLFSMALYNVYSANVLLLDRDRGRIFYSPEQARHEGCEQNIMRALEANGHQVTRVTVLPGDLSPYEVIFIVLGFACPT